MKKALAIPLVLGGVLACGVRPDPDIIPPPISSTSYAQDTLPKPATLVRRLAEAADGYRDGKNRFVVASRRFPHDVRGVFLTPFEARVEVIRAGADYGVFGPFQTLDDPLDMVSTPDKRVAEVIVIYRNGKQRRYGADSVDAIFWGLAAFDKFVAPYLTSVYGAAYAAEQREAYRRGKSEWVNSEQIAHKRRSF